MKKGKTPTKKAKPVAAKKSGAAVKKSSGGLLNKLKGALARKPAAKKPAAAAKKSAATAAKKPAKKVAKPAAKARPAPTPARKPAKVEPKKTSVAAGKTGKPVSKSPAKPTAAKASSPVKVNTAPAKPVRRKMPVDGLLTEDDIRAMSEAEYMNDQQMEFFRLRLLQMREEVLQREVDVKERLHEREVFADPADRATAEEEHWLDLRLRERESLLLKKIDDALRRIENKEYGYCEKTGDPIGIPRLLARPTATVCVDIKGQDERVEAQFRDR
ncbi:MAG TPA: RNA polymerase-binding protein DksA [Solimonas sp.]